LSLVLLAGGLGLLASLYLPWRAATCEAQEYFEGQPICGFLNLFSSRETIDGISASVGHVAAVFALLLMGLAAAVWIRPGLARRLPLGPAALGASYFGFAVALETRSDAQKAGLDSLYAYGAYAGMTASLIVIVAAVLSRRAELARLRSGPPPQLAMLLLAGLLLGALLLPWWREAFVAVDGVSSPATSNGLASPPAVVAAAITIFLAGSWSRLDTSPPARVGFVAAAALFTAGAAVSLHTLADRAWGVWPAVGIAGALLLLALLMDGRRIASVAQLPWLELAAAAAGLLFVASLFLPWQRWCYGMGSEFGPLAGRCFTTNAWTTTVGAAAALFALALLVAVLEPTRAWLSWFELVGTFGLLVVALGITLDEHSSPGFSVERGFGAIIGFAAAAVLFALALRRSRPGRYDLRRLWVRVLPIAACAGYLVIVTLPWWDVVSPFSEAIFAPFSWTTIIGVLLGIRLLRLWSQQIAGISTTAELALLPVALLALAAIDLIAQRDSITWGGGAVIGLCLLLALLGRIEQREGLESVRVPDMLRVDRL